MSRRFLFVCGCPRSGTSALVELLASDPRIAIGAERYAHLYETQDLTPDLFTKERFSSPRDGDTFYTDLLATNDQFYLPVLRNFESAIYVGDKIPELYRRFGRLAASLPGAKVVMIIRNIFDVAASFEARADKADDPHWSPDARTNSAVEKWGESLLALRNCPTAIEIFPVVYEELFLNRRGLHEIFSFLGLGAPHDEVFTKYDELCSWGHSLERKRERKLSAAAAFHICQAAPFDLYRELTAGKFTITAETKPPLPVGVNPDLEKLRELYQSMRFEEAARLLAGVDLDADWPPGILYYSAICLGAAGDPRRAIGLLKRCAAVGFEIFYSAYYLGLYEVAGGCPENAAYYFTIVLLKDPARSEVLRRLKAAAPQIRPEPLSAIQGGKAVPVPGLRERADAEAAEGNRAAAVHYLTLALWNSPGDRGIRDQLLGLAPGIHEMSAELRLPPESTTERSVAASAPAASTTPSSGDLRGHDLADVSPAPGNKVEGGDAK